MNAQELSREIRASSAEFDAKKQCFVVRVTTGGPSITVSASHSRATCTPSTKKFRVSGLNEHLVDCFYRSFRAPRATRTPDTARLMQSVASAMGRGSNHVSVRIPVPYSSRQGRGGSGSAASAGARCTGLRRGKLVDEELGCYVSSRNRFLNFVSGKDDCWGRGGEKTNAPHPMTIRIVKHLEEHLSLRPVLYQPYVYDPALRIATASDLLMRDERGNPHLVEVKCGFNGIYDIASNGERGAKGAKMNRSLSSVNNSYLNQHLLQLAMQREMFRAAYDISIPSANCHLVRAYDGGVERVTLKGTIMDRMSSRAYASLKTYLTKIRNDPSAMRTAKHRKNQRRVERTQPSGEDRVRGARPGSAATRKRTKTNSVFYGGGADGPSFYPKSKRARLRSLLM